MVHVDLDGARHVYRAHGWDWIHGRDPLFETGLPNTLDFLEASGVRATLFVIAEDLDDPAKRALLEDAVRRGHEIGSHTLTHRHLTTLPRAEQRREIAESRERLSSALGVPVDGFRAPGFRIDGEGLDLVAEAGYAFDSSRFGAQTGTTGAPGHQGTARRPLELPLPAHAPLPLPFHPSYALVLGTPYFRMGLRRFRNAGAALVMLFHLTDLAAPLAPAYLRGWRSRLFTLSHLDAASKRRRCQAMLDAVRRDYRMLSTRQLLSEGVAT